MYFEDFPALLAMDGHGAFVWAAVIISVLVMASQVITPMLRSRRFFVQQRMQLRREQSR
jgi:heme exporter protein D